MTTNSIVDLQHEVEQFLFHEAWLLDTGAFNEWLTLFTEDGLYWIPSQPEQTDPLETVSIVYEDLTVLRMRVKRLYHPRAHAMDPVPRTTHSLSNIMLDEHDDLVIARAILTVSEYRDEQTKIYNARTCHQLRREQQTLRIAHKRVDLLDCDGTHGLISIPF
jgi:benzoate/toluate 1,2-dioxygenase beta subunit